MAHLLSGFIGERNGRNFIGRVTALANQITYLFSDNAGFTAASASENQQRPINIRNGPLLRRIKGIQQKRTRTNALATGSSKAKTERDMVPDQWPINSVRRQTKGTISIGIDVAIECKLFDIRHWVIDFQRPKSGLVGVTVI